MTARYLRLYLRLAVFQPQLTQTASHNMPSVSQVQHVPQNVSSVYIVGQNGPASESQTGSQTVQTPHNLPSVYGVGQNYITSAAQPQSIFQPQLPQTASDSMPSVFGVGQDICHMQQVQHDQHGSDPISSLIASLQNSPTSQGIYAGQMVNTGQNLQTVVLGVSQNVLDSSLRNEFVDLNMYLPPVLASNSMPLTDIEPYLDNSGVVCYKQKRATQKITGFPAGLRHGLGFPSLW